ncbi:MAG: bifunctional precorrin-2 dehydrogenase/sirohydrochlorin ferrochelatase [Candidatus Adiutrix sp.]|jgi:precorrin-2 dehydrogenase/sirohydrochlorin ferrochelatase|nr:bifunctional precorrin-2 dehydrogenase/sirohydrochlorin ferrochelatase [Candidatus Adiutrix sp.]
MFLDLSLEGRRVLLVGAGRVGRRKLARLIAAGARPLVVEPRPGAEVSALALSGEVELHPRFTEALLEGVTLVFAASAEAELNQAVARAARARGLWVNVADAPESSDFFLPAVLTRGDFQVAVGTKGASPALAALAAARLAGEFGPEYEALARWLGRLRPLILNSGLPPAERRDRFRRLAGSDELLAHLARGRLAEAAGLSARLAAPVAIEELELCRDGPREPPDSSRER